MLVKYFGFEHTSFLIISIAIFIIYFVINLLWIKDKRIREIELKSLAVILFIFQIMNRITIAYFKNNWYELFPNTICSITSLVLAICVFFYKENNPLFQSIPLISIVGGVLNDIYPNYLLQNESFFFLPTITGIIHHTIAILLSLSLFIFSFVDLNKQKWYVLPLTFIIIFFYSLLIVELTPIEDCTNILKPMLANSIFYGPVVAVISIPVYFFVVYLKDFVKSKINNKSK